MEAFGTAVVIYGCCTCAVNNAKSRLEKCPTCDTQLTPQLRELVSKINNHKNRRLEKERQKPQAGKGKTKTAGWKRKA